MTSVEYLLQLIANGIVSGGVYALVALGLTLIFGVLGIINFAHGEFYMLGAYLGLALVVRLGLPYFGALAAAMAAVALGGILAERLVFRPLQRGNPTNSIISSFGLAVALQTAALHAFGPQPAVIRTGFARIPVSFLGVHLTLQRLLIPLVAGVLVVVFHVLVRHTWMGLSLRAVSQNPDAARLTGVDVNRVAALTFATGTALAGAAGVLIGSVFLMQPTMGSMVVLKAFTVVILGGMGNVYGAVGAGLLLGITESLTAGFLTNDFKDILAFLVVVLVLLVRPAGLFGKSLERDRG
ncbi:MAG: branched-chain amino acid ABC transporter permease [Candidatus Rokubacteria bacterium]|nr:branched-chain amino acid ABC transporter permease [Candidatus Rokubacteria bacterium]